MIPRRYLASHAVSAVLAALGAASLMLVATACNRAAEATTRGDGSAGPATASAATTPGAHAPDTTAAKLDQSRIIGNTTARVWLIMISDFQCPYCKQFHDESFEALRKDYVATGKVRMAYINFPLPSHLNAWPAAEARDVRRRPGQVLANARCPVLLAEHVGGAPRRRGQ